MPSFDELSPGDLVQRRERGELWQVLDVREPWEVALARLEDATCIPMNELPARRDELDPARPVAVLCHSGGRSARVAAWLKDSGFATVANVSGGIDAWSLQVDESIPRY